MELTNKYLIIEGNIGAGKTTMATKLAEQYNGKLILEQFHDNPFLPKFYSNPERYSFSLELSFLAARYKQLNTEISSTDLFKSFTIADYYFVKSLVFARTTLGEDEFVLYRQLFQIIYQQLPLPNLYVYLHSSPERLLQNISGRGREYEKSISADYLVQIQKSYFNYFKTEMRFPIVVIETTEIDFVNNPVHYQTITDIITLRTFENGLTWLVL